MRSSSGLTVNLYVLTQGRRLALVDAGLPGRSADIRTVLHDLGHSLDSLEIVLYTHTHIDHMGGGPDLAAHSNARHVLWHGCLHVAEDWHKHQSSMNGWAPWFEALVDDNSVLDRLRARRARRRDAASDAVDASGLIEPAVAAREGDRFEAGDFRLEPIHVPGHDPHHVALYDRDRKVVFSGDLVLPVPTPICTVMGDHLDTYLASLDRIETLDVEIGYGGHGYPMRSFAKRVQRSRQFVAERLERIIAFMEQHGTVSVFQLAVALTPDLAANLDHLGVILANVESSVHYLANAGQLTFREARVSLT